MKFREGNKRKKIYIMSLEVVIFIKTYYSIEEIKL